MVTSGKAQQLPKPGFGSSLMCSGVGTEPEHSMMFIGTNQEILLLDELSV